jgi:hypothetical protein
LRGGAYIYKQLKRSVKMFYNVSFSGQENGKTYKFDVNRDTPSVNSEGIPNIKIIISIDDNVVCEKPMNIQEMSNLLNNYPPKYKSDEKNDLRKTILTKEYPKIIDRLLCSFAESSAFFDYAGGYIEDGFGNYRIGKPGDFGNHVINSFEKCCYNSLLTDKTGDGKQPPMYFLKKTYDKNSSDILSLYDMGLLHKVDVKIEDGELRKEFCNYYVPFGVKINMEIQSHTVRAMWGTIVDDMKKASSRFK